MFIYKFLFIKLLLFFVFVVNGGTRTVAPKNTAQQNQIKINFLRDFVTKEVNARYIMYLCWPMGDLIKLRKLLMNKQIAFITDKQSFLNNDLLDHQLFRIMDLSCEGTHDILKIANETGYFDNPNKWILLYDLNDVYNRMSDVIETITFYAESNVIVAKIINSTFTLLELPYKYNNQGSKMIYEKYGYWTLKDGIVDQRSIKIISVRRQNIHKSIFNTSYVVTAPETTKKSLNDPRFNHIDSITKHSVWITKLIGEYLNSTLKLKPVNSWGRKLPNGTWTGMMKLLIDNVDHMAGTGMLLFPERATEVKYLARNSPTRVGILFRKPPLSFATNILRLSFQHWVWISIFLLMLLSLIIMRFSFTQEIKMTKETRENDANIVPLENEWSYICIFIMGGFCQQGAEIEPRGISGRILTIFVYFAMMFIYTSYSANIVALLQSSSDMIHSLGDITNSRMQAGVIDLEYGRTMFQKTPDPNRKLFYEKKVGPNGFYSYADGVERVRQGLFAFVVEFGPSYHYVAKTFLENEKCDLTELTNLGQSLSTFTVVPKRSPYAEIIKIGVMKIEERGLQQKVFYKIYKQKPQCSNAGANFVTVGLTDCYWAFVIWCSGIGVAIVAFTIEILFRKIYKNIKISFK